MRLLPKASRRAGFPVAAEDGNLRLLPDEEICLTYACCCHCEACQARADGRHIQICSCEHPVQGEEQRCALCGKNLAPQA